MEVEGFPKPSVHWFLGDVEITEKRTEYTRVEEGDNYKLIIKEVKTELKGRYTCKVENEYGENSSSSNLTVNTRPKLLKKLADQRLKEGDTLTLTFEVSGTPDPEVKWYKDGEEVTADARIKITRDSQRKESYDLTVTLLKGSDGGLYEVRAENELGYVTSKSKVIVLSEYLGSFNCSLQSDSGTRLSPKPLATQMSVYCDVFFYQYFGVEKSLRNSCAILYGLIFSRSTSHGRVLELKREIIFNLRGSHKDG